MPENTVSVTRPGKWGNPFSGEGAAEKFRAAFMNPNTEMTHEQRKRMRIIRDLHRDLNGKNLACWCKPGEPCHADALLEFSNIIWL